MSIELIIFDQDGTLYPRSHKLYQETRRITKQWILSNSDINLNNIDLIYDLLSTNYPNPYLGFMSLGLSVESYMENVFDKIHPKDILEYNPILYEYFRNNKKKKVLVTFSSPNYTNELQNTLGIKKYFNEILYVKDTTSYSKKECYISIANKFNVKNENIMVLGDNFENDIKPAIEIGCKTVLISEDGDAKNIEEFILKNMEDYY